MPVGGWGSRWRHVRMKTSFIPGITYLHRYQISGMGLMLDYSLEEMKVCTVHQNSLNVGRPITSHTALQYALICIKPPLPHPYNTIPPTGKRAFPQSHKRNVLCFYTRLSTSDCWHTTNNLWSPHPLIIPHWPWIKGIFASLNLCVWEMGWMDRSKREKYMWKYDSLLITE